MSFNTISVVGLGYIGLPTAAIIASRRKKVIGLDVNRNVVDTINKGNIHVVEPGLDIVVHSTVKDGYLCATTRAEPADAFLIAVPTPFKDDHQPDLSYIESAAKSIAHVLKPGDLVILESTSPVGTTEQMADWLAQARPDLTFPQTYGEESDIRIAHCPERVLPGHVVRELVENDRVIGGMTPKCSAAATDLYKIFVEGECIATNVRMAEMCKLTENSFRDVNIAFANELSIICDKLEIDVWELIKLANRHPRVSILQPGCGVGGHCIAVDPWFIVSQTPLQARLIRTAREVNDAKPSVVINEIINRANLINTKKVVALGVTFKPNIDDLRESPALKIVHEILNKGFEVQLVEPNVQVLPERLASTNCELVPSLNQIRDFGDKVVAILVAHQEFIGAASILMEIEALDFCGLTIGASHDG